MRGRWVLAACLLATVAAIAWMLRSQTPAVGTLPFQSVTTAASESAIGASAALDRRAAEAGRAGQAGDSLRGSDVDGAVHIDPDGRLQIDRDLRRLFDYFLTRLGEQPLVSIRAGLGTYLAKNNPQAICGAVLETFDRYVALLDELSRLAPSGDARVDLRRLHAARLARLGPDVTEAWFGSEERYLANTLDRQAVLADASLSAEQRQARLDALAAQLDPDERSARTPSDELELALAQSESFDAARTGAAERLSERTRLYGTEAAHRLAQLDVERAAWNGRLAAYASQRWRLLHDGGLDPAARAAALAALLNANFDERERLRVEALTRNNALPPPG
jgi:lipase chaperone LimK